MIATELFRRVRILSNSCYVRHWLHYNYPSKKPWLMAIAARDEQGPVEVPDLERDGFTKQREADGIILYTIERTGEDGEPFDTELY